MARDFSAGFPSVFAIGRAAGSGDDEADFSELFVADESGDIGRIFEGVCAEIDAGGLFGAAGRA